jgi:hypothetical protein
MNTLGSMVLLEKKPYTVHFLLLPKIIVNKKIATATLFPTCFCLPAPACR